MRVTKPPKRQWLPSWGTEAVRADFQLWYQRRYQRRYGGTVTMHGDHNEFMWWLWRVWGGGGGGGVGYGRRLWTEPFDAGFLLAYGAIKRDMRIEFFYSMNLVSLFLF